MPAPTGAIWQKLPLLPFERDLINLIGCTEAEYREFTRQAAERGRTRPAAYELVPDVQGGFIVPILINLAIGIALSAVSALLAPKPRQPQQITQRQLANKNGPSRFNSTYGFDSIAELATYGTPVPIPFGFYQGPENVNGEEQTYTGGILTTPKLVWSRTFSYGTHQAVKALYVVSETDIGVPDLNGVWLGNTALDAIYEHQFALYWNKEPGPGRIRAKHLIAGTRGSDDKADPWSGDDVFVCPTRDGANDSGFSMSYTPSANATFGVYEAVPNGTERRTNWRVISIPKQTDSRSRQTLNEERRKIAGNNDMYGVGMGYSRLMGIIEVDGKEYSTREEVEIRQGSRCTFRISGHKYNKKRFDHNVTMDDLIDEAEQERVKVDDTLQIGERFMIGKSVWRVVDRTDGIWQHKKDVDVELECVQVFGSAGTWASKIGVIPKSWLTLTTQNHGGDRNNTNHAQINFFPLLKADFGLVRNLRIADVTEIGIKSQVWAQMSGLCNFKTVPTPNELEELDDDNVQVTSGTMNLYFRRYSFFQILVRPAGDDQYGADHGWVGLGEEFCVRGSSPVDQFNYIRIQSWLPGQWEYKFAPLPCAYITRKPEEAEAFLLDAKNRTELQRDYDTAHGRFTIRAAGEMRPMHLLESSNLMYSKGREPDSGSTVTEVRPSSIVLNDYDTTLDGRAHAYRYEVFGNAKNYAAGTARTVTRTMTSSDGSETVSVQLTSICTTVTGNSWGQTRVWAPPSLSIDQGSSSTTRDWADGDIAEDAVTLSSGNPYANTFFALGVRRITAFYRVSVASIPVYYPPKPGELSREFEHDTQIAELSHYGDLIRRSCDNGPEHVIAYVNESVANQDQKVPQYDHLTMMGLVLRTNRTFTSMDQPRLWVRRGIKVEKLLPSATPEESSNNFAELVYWLLTNKRAGMGQAISPELVDREEMTRTAHFLEANRLYFDGVIEDRTNLRSFLSEVAPMMLCNFVIKNGKFSLVPAVPTDDAGNFSNVAVPIAAMFTDGNIIDSSFSVVYLDAEERRNFQASVTFRRGAYQQLPEQRTIAVRWKEDSGSTYIEESFDLSDYCTRRGHASMIARYLLSVRKRVDHTISFKTSPIDLSLGPGDYIKVFTEQNPYSPAHNGVVLADSLAVITPGALPDGSYPVTYFRPGSEQVEEGTLTVANGAATDPAWSGVIFSVKNTTVKEHVYLVEQLTLDEDGLVEINASYFPTDETGRSLIADDLLHLDRFVSLP